MYILFALKRCRKKNKDEEKGAFAKFVFVTFLAVVALSCVLKIIGKTKGTLLIKISRDGEWERE